MGEAARVYPLNRQQPEPLWREVLGGRLRALRAEREETLAETAERAGISPQYLSEVERGRKEPSSEMIAALAGALDTTLADLTTQVTEDLRRSRGSRSDPGTRGVRAPRASSAPSAPNAPSAPGAPSAPVLLALAA
jgi:transcriptional regulator with XRE-family HTH domain